MLSQPPSLIRKHKKFWTKSDIDVFYWVYFRVYMLPYILYTIPIQIAMRYDAKILNNDLFVTAGAFLAGMMVLSGVPKVFTMF